MGFQIVSAEQRFIDILPVKQRRKGIRRQARKCTKCGEDISDIRPTCKRQNKVQDKAQEKTGRFCLSSVEDDYAFDLLAKSSSVFWVERREWVDI